MQPISKKRLREGKQRMSTLQSKGKKGKGR
jgi:hypothetical protein